MTYTFKENYQPFLLATLLLIIANYWHLFSDNPLIPRSADYIAYGLFTLGIITLFKNKN